MKGFIQEGLFKLKSNQVPKRAENIEKKERIWAMYTSKFRLPKPHQ